MQDRTTSRLVEQNCRAYELFRQPPRPPAPPVRRPAHRKGSADERR